MVIHRKVYVLQALLPGALFVLLKLIERVMNHIGVNLHL